MKEYTDMNINELRDERQRTLNLLKDAEDERSFLGMQTGQHIKTAEFNRIDQDIAKFRSRLEAIDATLATKGT